MPHPARTVSDLVVADVVGITLHELHVLHPADLASPRDFTWSGRNYLYTAAGVRLLARALREDGQGAASQRVEAIITQHGLERNTPQMELGGCAA